MTNIVHWAKVHDGRYVDALATSVSPSGYQGPVKKTKIASYFGNAFVAERDDEGLHIFHIGTGVGLPVDLVGGSTGDSAKGPMTAAKMQAISEEWRRRNAVPKRVQAAGRR